jgi:hypothetical protein
MVDKLYKFTNKKTGKSWGYSRHEFPDFCSNMTKEERNSLFIVEEITDKDEIEKNLW